MKGERGGNDHERGRETGRKEREIKEEEGKGMD